MEDLLNSHVNGMDWDEKSELVKRTLVEIEKEKSDWDQSNKGKSWKDEELRAILSAPPTVANALKFAKAFKRGYGSIEQIYRWAGQGDDVIDEKRPNDSFIQQIKRVRNELNWKSVGMSS
ncbi:hypothetical protein [Salinibacter altiplanensis]|uniref:hypothetical protein n=1 Tax=Salinibacter altiplanensis TaxID=1803181 RepID=UPI001F41B011|nr:hypothetical protein [Salinibacter altiplanensis]